MTQVFVIAIHNSPREAPIGRITLLVGVFCIFGNDFVNLFFSSWFAPSYSLLCGGWRRC